MTSVSERAVISAKARQRKKEDKGGYHSKRYDVGQILVDISEISA